MPSVQPVQARAPRTAPDSPKSTTVIETISDLIALVRRIEDTPVEPPVPHPPKLLLFGVACSAGGLIVLAIHLML